jgi:hypothetical protein
MMSTLPESRDRYLAAAAPGRRDVGFAQEYDLWLRLAVHHKFGRSSRRVMEVLAARSFLSVPRKFLAPTDFLKLAVVDVLRRRAVEMTERAPYRPWLDSGG